MSLQYSLYNNESENIGPMNQKNQVQKKDNKRSIAKIKALLSSSAPEKPDENSLADFVPLSYPEVNMENKKRKKRQKEKEQIDYNADDISIEKDEDLETTQTGNNYYKQYVSQSMDNSTANQVPQSSSTAPKDELLEKLNYMIHLLEEQNDEKTANVTEELILYMFLGVFIIFVLDSFAKMGKYVR